MGSFKASATSSRKPGKDWVKYHAAIDWHWLTIDGSTPAPFSQVIFYPQYPETRLSGFLRGAVGAPVELLRRETQGVGRWLVLGVAADGVYAIVLPPDAPAVALLRDRYGAASGSLVRQIDVGLSERPAGFITAERLLEELAAVWVKSPVPGCRISDGRVVAYGDRPAAGTTLETILGVKANAVVGPDFHGWELKSFGSSRVTLMTPAPTGGMVKEDGFEAFMRAFGYVNPSKHRWEFAGVQAVGRSPVERGGWTLEVHGYRDGITDPGGSLAVVDANGRAGATWAFEDLLNHWRLKHANAAYVPNKRIGGNTFSFGPIVKIATGANFSTFVRRLADGTILFDPGCHWQPGGMSKRRYQFRVTKGTIDLMYETTSDHDLRETWADDTLSTREVRALGIELPVAPIGRRPPAA